MGGLDKYTLQARLAPVLLTVAPAIVSIGATFPAEVVWTGLAGSAALSVALAVFLGHLGRDLGKAKEPELFELWGGPPTTTVLRHATTWLSPVTFTRYRRVLETLLSLELPTPEDERLGAQQADDIYRSCVDYLREATRDSKRFPLVFAENVNYGFRRNLFGLRLLGLASALFGLALTSTVGLGLLKYRTLPIAVLVAGVFDAILVSLWLLLITPEWVHVPAKAYAERLLGACETLASPGVPPGK